MYQAFSLSCFTRVQWPSILYYLMKCLCQFSLLIARFFFSFYFGLSFFFGFVILILIPVYTLLTKYPYVVRFSWKRCRTIYLPVIVTRILIFFPSGIWPITIWSLLSRISTLNVDESLVCVWLWTRWRCLYVSYGATMLQNKFKCAQMNNEYNWVRNR